MKISKTLFIAAILLIFLSLVTVGVKAVPYHTYYYNFWEEAVPSPPAYRPAAVITGRDLGIGNFATPRDIYVKDNLIYLLDSGNDRIIILDEKFELLEIIKQFENKGQPDSFNNPTGITVKNNLIYLADRGNNRVLIFNEEFELQRIIKSPQLTSDILAEDFNFRPTRVDADAFGRIYVIAAGVYEGIMSFDNEGLFQGFIGAPEVDPDVRDYFWRRILTEEQRGSLALFLPTEYSNLFVDDRGFIYATVSGGALQEEQAVRMLNPAGTDNLRRSGFHPPIGDIDFPDADEPFNIPLGRSVLVDIAVREMGIFSVLDRRRGRIFTYDMNGNLLYVFGGPGNSAGTFENATALSYLDDKLLVLDRSNHRLTLFEPDNYARKIHQAISLSETGKYEEAEKVWQEVIHLNNNFEHAYSSLAYIQYRRGEYDESLAFFRRGNNREGYSRAFEQQRPLQIKENFNLILVLLMLVIVTIILSWKFKILAKGKEVVLPTNLFFAFLKKIFYVFHLIFHPFGSFWDLKHEKRGSLPAAIFWLLMVNIIFVFNRQYTAFIFNERNLNQLNILREMASVLLPFFLFCIVNWSLTTFMEGKGTFKDIFIYSSYALSPFVLIMLPATIISYGLIFPEENFLYALYVLALLWPAMLIFTGTLVTHDYSLSGTFFNLISTIVGMGIILFLGLLFFNVIDLMIVFINDIYLELTLRI